MVMDEGRQRGDTIGLTQGGPKRALCAVDRVVLNGTYVLSKKEEEKKFLCFVLYRINLLK